MTNIITNRRALVEAVRQASERFGIEYKLFSDDWVIKLSKGERTLFVYASGLDCNGQAAAAIALDKVATYLMLDDAGLPVIPHFLLTSPSSPAPKKDQLRELFNKYGELVIKPTLGKRGQYVRKCDDVAAAVRHIQENPDIDSWAASPFIDVDKELRLVLFDGRPGVAYEKHAAPVINGLKMHNINLGATAKTVALGDVDDQLKELAATALNALGLRLAAVDIVFDATGQPFVLEINSRFSLEHYASSSADNRRLVVDFYSSTIGELFADY